MREKPNKNLNEVLFLSSKILRIFYILLFIAGIYIITMVLKEWKILDFVLKILRVLSPLFIGLVIAWLLKPVVVWLTNKGLRKGLAIAIVYIVLIGLIYLIISTFIPVITAQINDLASLIPSIITKIQSWLDNVFKDLSVSTHFRENIMTSIDNIGKDLTTDLPGLTINIVTSIVSSISSLVLGLVIGFYMLFNFDNVGDIILKFIPTKFRKSTSNIMSKIDSSLRSFVQGTLFLATIIFATSSFIFFIIGLKVPLLFGIICGITDLIPYIGPFIGGSLAVIVGFSIDINTGIFALIGVFIVQCLENFVLQPVIMSKTMKLHPVTIIVGLLIFGSLFGIVGMLFATPVISTLKIVYTYFNEKYDFFKERKRVKRV